MRKKQLCCAGITWRSVWVPLTNWARPVPSGQKWSWRLLDQTQIHILTGTPGSPVNNHNPNKWQTKEFAFIFMLVLPSSHHHLPLPLSSPSIPFPWLPPSATTSTFSRLNRFRSSLSLSLSLFLINTVWVDPFFVNYFFLPCFFNIYF